MDETSDSAATIDDEEEQEESNYEEEEEDDDDYDEEEPLGRSRDRISDLPNSIITHILSMIPTIYAVRTGVLSKRWRHIWASTPVLKFSLRWNDPPFNGFVEYVDKVMILHKGPKIKKFSLEVDFERTLEPSINLWIFGAVIKQVEELVLQLDDNDNCVFDSNAYLLPHWLLSCSSLMELSLRFCKFGPSSSVCWKSLKSLTLNTLERLTDAVIQRVLDGSPVLECLELIGCGGFHRIDVSSASLRRLVVNGYWNNEYRTNDDWLQISAPNIVSLEILGYMDGKRFRVESILSLVQVRLGFSMRYEGYDVLTIEEERPTFQIYQNMLVDLLRKVHHVEKLTIGFWCIQVLSMCKLSKLPSTVHLKCKCLVMNTPLYVQDLPGMAKLLQSSLLLERLVIDLNGHDRTDQIPKFPEFSRVDGNSYWKSRGKAFKRLFNHLKVVEFIGISNSDFALNFAQFLLQHAKVLEKMVFTPKRDPYRKEQGWLAFGPSNYVELSQKLLSFPRSSTNAKILLL